VGGPAFAKLAASTAIDGLLLVYGALSKELNAQPVIQAIRRRLTIRGFAANGSLGDDDRLGAFKRFVLEGIDSGSFHPKNTGCFPSRTLSMPIATSNPTSSWVKLWSPFSMGYRPLDTDRRHPGTRPEG